MDDFLKQSRVAFRNLYGFDTNAEGPIVNDPRGFDLARRNRVVGLWTDSSETLSLGEEWSRYAYGQILHSTRMTAEAERIVQALQGKVKDLRLVKGPALSSQAWPKSGLRSFDDLDFRCDQQSFDAITSGLTSLGYRPKIEDRIHQENLWSFGWGIEFRHPDGMMVEFNHRMFPPHFPWPKRLTQCVSDRWVSLEIDSCSINCPSPALHLLLSCVHAVWHGWERLGWVVDIAGLLVLHPHILEEAKRLTGKSSFLQQALLCGCHVAERIFGPFPTCPGFENSQEPLIEQALQLLMRKEPGVPIQTQRQIHAELMSPLALAFYTVRRGVTPGDPDFKQWSLPSSRRFLYWFLRPLRITMCSLGHSEN